MFRFPKYDSYRHSGVEWLGEIPSHWETVRAKRIFRTLSEKNCPDAQLLSVTQDQGVVPREWLEQRVVMPTGQLQTFKLVREGDFVISLRSFQGGIEYSGHTGLVSPAYTVLRKQRNMNSGYMKHLLKSAGFISELNTTVTGIRQGKNIDFEDFSFSFLPVPSLDEQTRIATFLDEKTAEIDAAIAKKQRLIELLQEQKALLINRAVTKGLDPGIPLRDSGVEWIGEIPSHWEIISSKWMFAHRKERSRLSDQHLTASQEYGVIPQQEYMDKTGYRVMQVTLNTEILKHVEVDDFVISMRSFQGGLERAKASGCISSAYVVLESSPQANVDYFAYLFKSVRYIEALQSTSNLVRDGQALRYDNFCMVPLPVVPIKEQEAIAAFLDQATSQMDTLREKIQKEIELLKEFRTILISQAVTGKIKV